MAFWEGLWKVVFFAGVLLFAGMAVWVTVGGFLDIKRLFRKMREHSEDPDDEEK